MEIGGGPAAAVATSAHRCIRPDLSRTWHALSPDDPSGWSKGSTSSSQELLLGIAFDIPAERAAGTSLRWRAGKAETDADGIDSEEEQEDRPCISADRCGWEERKNY